MTNLEHHPDPASLRLNRRPPRKMHPSLKPIKIWAHIHRIGYVVCSPVSNVAKAAVIQCCRDDGAPKDFNGELFFQTTGDLADCLEREGIPHKLKPILDAGSGFFVLPMETYIDYCDWT